jgi:hypothetical protein
MGSKGATGSAGPKGQKGDRIATTTSAPPTTPRTHGFSGSPR